MRVWFGRRMRTSSIALLVFYTVVICYSGYAFCSLHHCRECNQITQREKELVNKLVLADHRLGLQSMQDKYKERKETMPKHVKGNLDKLKKPAGGFV